MENMFKLEIIPETRMLPVALSSAREAGLQFFDKQTAERIVLSLEEALQNVAEYCVSDHLDSITIEAGVENGDFVLTVTDKGMPGDLETMLQGENALGLSLMHKMMDRVSIENLGPAGRRQRLFKHIANMPEFSRRQVCEDDATSADVHLSIRPLRQEEAVEVARCIYDEFGFTYPTATVYYPDEFFAATQRGEIYSLVAVTDENEIAAHLAIWQWSSLPGIWEMGMGVVKHRFRNAHIMGRLTEAIRDYARDGMQLSALLCEPVLYHPFTQKISNRSGFIACGAGLSYVPAGFHNSFKNTPDIRNNVAIAMAVFQRKERTLYLNPQVLPLVQDVLSRMELPCRLVTEPSPCEASESETLSEAYPSFGLGRIIIYRTGRDVAQRLRLAVTELKRQNVEVIELFIQINEPGAQTAYLAAEEIGFFCTGLIPFGRRGDMLMMENLFSQSVDYDTFQTVEPFTGVIRNIRALDPDQIQKGADGK